MLTQKQEAFFKKSKVRDGNGDLIPMFHGTGTVITEFDPAYTAQGDDQYGSGFYFTLSRTLAESYTATTVQDETGKDMEKLGGCDAPNVVEAYLNLVNPIIVDGARYANLGHVVVTADEAYRMLLHQPDLYLPQSGSEDFVVNPLGDYFDDYWTKEQFTEEEYRHFIRRLADQYYAGTNLRLLDIFLGSHGTEFRTAVREVLGYDGVMVKFDNGSWHAIAWFPNQIKAISNSEPTEANGIFD